MFTTTFRTAYLLRHGEFSKQLPQAQRSTIARLFSSGAATFAFGFLIWNLDNVFCSKITRWKQTVGWPAAFLLEGEPDLNIVPELWLRRYVSGHSWWHILTVCCFSIINLFSSETETLLGDWNLPDADRKYL